MIFSNTKKKLVHLNFKCPSCCISFCCCLAGISKIPQKSLPENNSNRKRKYTQWGSPHLVMFHYAKSSVKENINETQNILSE